MVLGPSEPWAHGHDMEGSSHKRHRTALPPGWGDPVLYQWQPPWHQEEAKGGGKKEGGGEGQGEEMSENSPDSIADMMAGDKDGDSDSDGGGESDRKGRDAKAGSGRGR